MSYTPPNLRKQNNPSRNDDKTREKSSEFKRGIYKADKPSETDFNEEKSDLRGMRRDDDDKYQNFDKRNRKDRYERNEPYHRKEYRNKSSYKDGERRDYKHNYTTSHDKSNSSKNENVFKGNQGNNNIVDYDEKNTNNNVDTNFCKNNIETIDSLIVNVIGKQNLKVDSCVNAKNGINKKESDHCMNNNTQYEKNDKNINTEWSKTEVIVDKGWDAIDTSYKKTSNFYEQKQSNLYNKSNKHNDKVSESYNDSWSAKRHEFKIYDESSFDETIHNDDEYYIESRTVNSKTYTELKCDTKLLPLASFTDLKLPNNLFRYLNQFTPTSIQAFAIPAILKNKNVLARAPTGLGKTLSFLVPLLLKLGHTKKPKLRILIITPTRELALQINTELEKLISDKKIDEEDFNNKKNLYIKSVALYGGTDERISRSKLSTGCDIIVATPGRLCDYIERNIITLKNVKFFVMDEADRMLDMGFEKELKYIKNELMHHNKRQTELFTYMFSATFEKRLKSVVDLYLGNDRINIEYQNETIKNIKQEIIEVENIYEKKEKLIKLLKNPNFANKKILIFVETKSSCQTIESYINHNECQAVSLHGDKTQYERERALGKFTRNECYVLVATSVASRGLDIPSIELVINFDLPKDIKEYIHRIGRSGRCGKDGKAISFYFKNDIPLKEGLILALKESENNVPDFLLGRDKSFRKETFRNETNKRNSSNRYEENGRRHGNYIERNNNQTRNTIERKFERKRFTNENNITNDISHSDKVFGKCDDNKSIQIKDNIYQSDKENTKSINYFDNTNVDCDLSVDNNEKEYLINNSQHKNRENKEYDKTTNSKTHERSWKEKKHNILGNLDSNVTKEYNDINFKNIRDSEFKHTKESNATESLLMHKSKQNEMKKNKELVFDVIENKLVELNINENSDSDSCDDWSRY